MNILLTGASGLVGTQLTAELRRHGYDVGHLVRKASAVKNVMQFSWSPQEGRMDAAALEWADVILHLAGANVAESRWTAARKKEIIDSRIKGLELIARELGKVQQKPALLISASGVGIYGLVTNDHIYSETDQPANDFFGDCCRRWETAADLSETEGLRVVKFRIAAVLAKEAGVLPKLAGPVKWFVGSALGSGKQWMPWIHIDDLCAMFLLAIENHAISGAYNAVAPEHITNRGFVKAIGKQLKRAVFLPAVPTFALQLVLGEMSKIVTTGSRVSNEKITKAGFAFQFPSVAEALKDLL